ncbi:hypothetical protein [Henriciella aquimarina]|uniref:hypothetical protein n=1 Tax=Henriciella aquimarina TaxID=545261 RepID=UPI00117A2BBB|nr:hypothetical protein [Henriciella aquimarina]
MVLGVVLALAGVWVGVPLLGVVPDDGSVRLFSGLALGAFAIGYTPAGGTIETGDPVRLWRRLSAFLIDLAVLFLALHPVLSMLRVAPAIMIGLTLVFCYFWLQARAGRPSAGQTIMGYRIVAAEGANGEPEYAMRTVTAFLATCLWPFTIISASQKDAVPGHYAWDRETNTRTVMVVGLAR